MNAPRALAAATSALSCGAEPCDSTAARSLKMRGELTIAACSGCASGTLMTSMRKRAVLGSCSGLAFEQPANSLGDRAGAEPETYTYTFSGSFGSISTVCVCEPRHVCTLVMLRGWPMSEMSKMRMPRMRAVLTVSFTPSPPQSMRPDCPSADTNSRFL